MPMSVVYLVSGQPRCKLAPLLRTFLFDEITWKWLLQIQVAAPHTLGEMLHG